MADLSQATRDAVRGGAIRSASAVLSHYARDRAAPAGVLDVGAGEGHWLDAAHALWPGASMFGVDLIQRSEFPMVSHWDADGDVELPLHAGPGWRPAKQCHHLPEQHCEGCESVTTHRRWPLVLCLETAEHLKPSSGDRLVAELCRVGREVLWSAAIPGQGGDGHVNEQPPAYWSERFNRHGFFLSDPFRMRLWGDAEVESWYRQNLLLAQPAAIMGDGCVLMPESGEVGQPWRTTPPPHLVHPAIWAHYRGLA